MTSSSKNLVRPPLERAVVTTNSGALIIDDCLNVLRTIPDCTFDLVLTSPPYDGQSKYGNGERYERDWYKDTFLRVSKEILRTLKPHGTFVLNYRSKRHGDERGTLQYGSRRNSQMWRRQHDRADGEALSEE